MDVAFATNFLESTGSPVFQLKMIAEAGFTHVHWCHHWNTDFLYGKYEIEQCSKWLKEFGLRLTDIHGSDGQEKSWYSPVEYQRKAGVELVLNRLQMMDAMGGSGATGSFMRMRHSDSANAGFVDGHVGIVQPGDCMSNRYKVRSFYYQTGELHNAY